MLIMSPVDALAWVAQRAVGAGYEAGGIARDGAKFVTAVATAKVPKLTLV
jgi:hypothetical protein